MPDNNMAIYRGYQVITWLYAAFWAALNCIITHTWFQFFQFLSDCICINVPFVSQIGLYLIVLMSVGGVITYAMSFPVLRVIVPMSIGRVSTYALSQPVLCFVHCVLRVSSRVVLPSLFCLTLALLFCEVYPRSFVWVHPSVFYTCLFWVY